MASTENLDLVQKIYIAYYGRPADPLGQTYWADVIDAANGDVASVINAFGTSAEATAIYGNLPPQAAVNNLYKQLFGRDADAAGLKFYVDGLGKGDFTLASIALAIANGATGTDVTTLNAKIAAANAFTAAVDTTPEIVGYAGDAAAAAARAELATVVDAASSSAFVTNVDANVSGVVIAGTNSQGQTYALSENVDNVPGTSGNDTIIAGEGALGGVHTLGSSDVINGGAGTDTLNLRLAGGAASGQVVTPNIAAVEVFNVQAIGADNGGATPGGDNGINLINATGYTELWSNNSTNDLALTNAGTKAVIGVSKGVAAADYSVQYAAAAVTGAQDIILDDATVGNLYFDTLGTGAAGATGFATVNVNAKAGTSTVGNLQSGQDITTLNVTGAGKLTVTAALNAGLKTIDASGNSGGTTLQIAAFSGENVTYTGGSGDDSINFNDTLTLLDKVDGGAGRNTLVVDDESYIVKGLNVSNIQVLSLDSLNDATVDAGLIAGVDQVNVTATLGAGITAGAADSKINGLSSGNTVAIADTGAVLINVKNATVAGTADTFNLKVTNGADVNFQLPGVETINLNNATKGAWSDITFSDADGLVDLRTLNVSSATDSDTTLWGLNNTIKNVDASTALGDVYVSVAAGNPTNGVNIAGGAGDDTLIGGDGKDVIVGGAGDDWLQGDANSGWAQTTTLSSFGTVEIGDTYSFTVDGQTVSFTATAATQANVVAGLQNALNGNAIIAASGVTASVDFAGNLLLTGQPNGTAFTVANVASTNAVAAAQVSTYDFGVAGFDAGDSVAANVGGQAITTGALGAATSAVGAAAIFATAINSNAALAAAGVTALVTGHSVVVTGNADGTAFGAGNPTVTNAPATPDQEKVTFAASAAGDVYNVTVEGVALTPIVSNGTVANDASALTNLINSNAALAALGVTATSALGVTTIVDAQGQDLGVVTTKAGTGTATVDNTVATGVVVTANAVSNAVTVAGHGVGATGQTLPTVDTNAGLLGGTPNADTLTGGDGNDTFGIMASGGKVGTTFTTMDTITDLNLGGSAVASQVDSVWLTFSVNSLVNAGVPVALTTAPTLVDAVDVLFAAGGVLNNQANKAGLFTYAGDTYLVAAQNAGATFGADDVIVKVTGVTGTLDLSDLV